MEGLRLGAPLAQTGRVMGMRNPQVPSIDLFLLVRVALKLRSLHIHPPRLYRLAVFSIQTNVPPPRPGRVDLKDGNTLKRG